MVDIWLRNIYTIMFCSLIYYSCNCSFSNVYIHKLWWSKMGVPLDSNL